MPVSPLFRCTILSMLFAFASQSLMAGSSGLEWQRINISYNGLVVRHSVIATYGSSGAYTLSTNDGATWQRKQLSTEDDRILAMSASSKGWAAITGNGFLFRTENVAGAWTKTAHGVQNAISVAMLNSGGCIVVSKNAVYRIGSAGMATDSLRFRADSINTIAYHPDRPLLYAADVSGTLETIDMETLTRIRTTDFTALGFCSPCTTLNYVFATADTLFAQTDSQLFRSVNGGETWNIQNSSILQNVGRGIINSNGDVRFVRTTFINPNTLFSIPVCSSLVGRSVVRISDTLPERNTRYAFFTNSTFKGTDTIFCVGWENTIVMSVNKGKTWRTVSNFAPYFYGTWLNEAHGYMGGYDGNRVFRTIDSGATWLPQFYDKLNAKGQVVMIAFDSSGNGIIGNGDVLMTTPDSGNTYTPVPTGTGIATSFFTSRHYPLTMNRYAFINNIFSLGIMYCTLTTLDSSFKKIRTVGERNMQFISLYKVAGDTLRGWFFASGASSAFLLRHIMPGDSTWTVERIIPDSYNLKGISNAVLIDGHIIATRNQSRTVNGTYYSDGTLAVLNTTTGAWLPDTLHFQDKNIYNIFLLNNELYTTCNPVLTVSAEEINKHSSIQNFMQYTVDSSNKLVNLPLLVSSFSNVAIISSRVSQQNILYKVISATTPTSVEEELNAQTEQSYISVLPPYPNPARTAIRLPVYFQSTEEFGAKNCTVINNLGERLPESARISFNGTSPHSGELLWDCSGVPSGTYYMLISFGTAKRAVPILVVRE